MVGITFLISQASRSHLAAIGTGMVILGAVLWQPIGQFLLNRLNYSGVFATGPQTQGNLDLFNPIGVAYHSVVGPWVG